MFGFPKLDPATPKPPQGDQIYSQSDRKVYPVQVILKRVVGNSLPAGSSVYKDLNPDV